MRYELEPPALDDEAYDAANAAAPGPSDTRPPAPAPASPRVPATPRLPELYVTSSSAICDVCKERGTHMRCAHCTICLCDECATIGECHCGHWRGVLYMMWQRAGASPALAEPEPEPEGPGTPPGTPPASARLSAGESSHESDLLGSDSPPASPACPLGLGDAPEAPACPLGSGDSPEVTCKYMVRGNAMHPLPQQRMRSDWLSSRTIRPVQRVPYHVSRLHPWS